MAGIAGLKSAELRANPLIRELALHIGSELIRVAAAIGVSPEPIWSVPADMLIMALEDDRTKKDVEKRMMEAGKTLGTGILMLADFVNRVVSTRYII